MEPSRKRISIRGPNEMEPRHVRLSAGRRPSLHLSGVFCAAYFAALLISFAHPVRADVQCGDTIFEDTRLLQDLNCTGRGLTVQGPATLNLNRHTVDCDCGHATIELVGEGAVLTNGRIISRDPTVTFAVYLAGSGNHRIVNTTLIALYAAIYTATQSGVEPIHSANNSIINNTIEFLTETRAECGWGIVVRTENNRIVNNDIAFCRWITVDSNSNQLIANKIKLPEDGVLTGIAVTSGGVGFDGHRRGHSNTIRANRITITDNTQVGINVNAGAEQNEIKANRIIGSSETELRDGNEDCDQNRWSGNKFETANQECIR